MPNGLSKFWIIPATIAKNAAMFKKNHFKPIVFSDSSNDSAPLHDALGLESDQASSARSCRQRLMEVCTALAFRILRTPMAFRTM